MSKKVRMSSSGQGDTKTIDVSQVDSIVQSVISKFVGRAAVGRQKYGTDLDRTDLGTADWIQHAQEELMDGILYLEKLRQQMGVERP